MKKSNSISDVQDSTLNGFNRTLRAHKSHPTFLETLVKKGASVYVKTETLTPEKMATISKLNSETIEALDNKTVIKRKYITGLEKPKVIIPSNYSKVQNGTKNMKVGETITINGRTFRKTK